MPAIGRSGLWGSGLFVTRIYATSLFGQPYYRRQIVPGVVVAGGGETGGIATFSAFEGPAKYIREDREILEFIFLLLSEDLL